LHNTVDKAHFLFKMFPILQNNDIYWKCQKTNCSTVQTDETNDYGEEFPTVKAEH